MTALELRTKVHELIDKIEDKAMLSALVSFLISAQKANPGDLWQSLSVEEKKEVLLSFDESEQDENLVTKKDFLDSL